MAAPFYRQSNYFRVGMRYAERLEKAGMNPQAATVRRRIGLAD